MSTISFSFGSHFNDKYIICETIADYKLYVIFFVNFFFFIFLPSGAEKTATLKKKDISNVAPVKSLEETDV